MANKKANIRDFWLYPRPRYLMQLIAEAQHDQYDAVVYDTGFEYDPTDLDAVMFVASVAMSKYIWIPRVQFPTTGHYDIKREQMPMNDTVISKGFATKNDNILWRRDERAAKERMREFYLP